MPEWFQEDSFWSAFYPFLFSAQRLESAQEEVAHLLALVGGEGQKVLDLCCGPGRHAVALALRGFEVTGVDRTPFLLEKARERAREHGVEIEWIASDMRRFLRPGAFDLVLSMFTSLGYFDSREEDRKVLHNIHHNLKYGGSALFEVLGKEVLARIFQPTTSERLPDGSMVIERHEILPGWNRIRNEWILLKKGRTETYKFDLRIYSGRELRDDLRHVGFEEVCLYGDLQGHAYDNEATRLVVVARKAS